jgi:hypothetical protein
VPVGAAVAFGLLRYGALEEKRREPCLALARDQLLGDRRRILGRPASVHQAPNSSSPKGVVELGVRRTLPSLDRRFPFSTAVSDPQGHAGAPMMSTCLPLWNMMNSKLS